MREPLTGPIRLPTDAWRAESSSVVDPVGRIIHHEGRILRGIRAPFVSETLQTLKAAEAGHWFDHGLVHTWATPHTTDGFPLVLEHQRVPFVTLRAEWSAEGLKRAALCHLELSDALARSGYCLKDAHTWNVLFDGTQPVVTDFGSIRPLAELCWDAWLPEFDKYFLVPLLLFKAGRTALARALMREHVIGVGNWLIDHDPAALGLGTLSERLPGPHAPEATFGALRQLIEDLSFPVEAGEWTAYPQPVSCSGDSLRTKDRLVEALLSVRQSASVMDLGTNHGLHAFMSETRGALVLACDIDEACLNDVYVRARQANARILPLYVDVVWPLGTGGAFATIASAHDRLRCDLVLALALVHHVCMRQRFDPDAFVAGLAAFAHHAAIVEFVPADDWHVAQWGLVPPAGYSIDEFHTSLARRFDRVVRVPSDPSPRVFFVCEGKH